MSIPRFLPVLALLAAAAALSLADDAATVSTTTAAVEPAVRVNARRDVLFYSDLGPDSIDVSAYPAEQRANYAVYARACARCHSLARSINAPYVGRGWWEFYMTGMRMRGRLAGRPFSREETKAVLDFLDYDSRVRKVEHAAEFEKRARELKKRFDASVDQRMDELQHRPQPRLIP